MPCCNDCHKATATRSRKTNHKYYLNYRKLYYLRHKEQEAEYKSAYDKGIRIHKCSQITIAERVAAERLRKKQYYQDNKEHIKKQVLKNYFKNIDKWKAYQKKYYKKNKKRIAALNKGYYEAKKLQNQ
jgi:hypothetical protein